jgi:hypothetical protein
VHSRPALGFMFVLLALGFLFGALLSMVLVAFLLTVH